VHILLYSLGLSRVLDCFRKEMPENEKKAVVNGGTARARSATCQGRGGAALYFAPFSGLAIRWIHATWTRGRIASILLPLGAWGDGPRLVGRGSRLLHAACMVLYTHASSRPYTRWRGAYGYVYGIFFCILRVYADPFLTVVVDAL
jgi:hypothetical protein